MVEFRKLSPQEVEKLRERRRSRTGPSKRQQIREEYRRYVSGLKPGDWGEIKLEPNDNRNTIRARLHRAAAELGVELDFKRSRGEVMHFEVRSSRRR